MKKQNQIRNFLMAALLIGGTIVAGTDSSVYAQNTGGSGTNDNGGYYGSGYDTINGGGTLGSGTNDNGGSGAGSEDDNGLIGSGGGRFALVDSPSGTATFSHSIWKFFF